MRLCTFHFVTTNLHGSLPSSDASCAAHPGMDAEPKEREDGQLTTPQAFDGHCGYLGYAELPYTPAPL